jgi:glutathionyl-hydroquinone reductase
MTTVAPQFASPVDYEAYGVYGPKRMGGADRTFVRPRYPFEGRVSADGSTWRRLSAGASRRPRIAAGAAGLAPAWQ